MRTSSRKHYRAFIKVLLASASVLVIVTICDLTNYCPPFTLTSYSTPKIKLSLPTLSSTSSSLDLSVEGDHDSLRGKCVAVRIKGSEETMTLDEVLSGKVQLPSRPKVGLIFLDKRDGFISSGKVVNQTGVFHLYHYLEFLLVAYQQLQELQEHYDPTIHLSSPDSPIQVPWIYVPLLQAPLEVCGVANSINCRIASLLLQSPSWYGMESNPSWLQASHPAYHGQHDKRHWDEEKLPLTHEENYEHMQETADMAFIISLRHKDRCNHKGRIYHGWNEYSDVFPSKMWHDSLTSNLEKFPLPAELVMPKSHELLVCYIDRQVTPRRMPDSEHAWLLKYLKQHSQVRLWHLMMQNYDGMVQLRVASQCQVMIGVHGNGLSHLLWMKPKSHVIELYWDDLTRQGGYELLARTMQHNYLAIRKGWLVLDSTHPVYEKQVQILKGVDPLKNGRRLIQDFLEKVLVTAEIPKHVDSWGDTHPRQCNGKPMHIHLAVGRDPQREMTISFASEWSDLSSARIAGVRYGKSPDHLDMYAREQGSALFYNSTFPSDPKALRSLYFSPYQHHVTLRDLEPETTYYYRPVLKDNSHDSDSSSEESAQNRRFLAPKPYNGFKKACTPHRDVRTFKTAPLEQKPRPNKPMVTFGIVGDLGQFTHSQTTMARMQKDSLDLVHLVGDIAYTSNDHRRWDTFFDFLDDFPLFHSTPLQIATGNHDVEKSVDRPDIFQAYESRFRMPQVRPAELGMLPVTDELNMNEPPYPLPYEWGNAYYSFAYGPSKHIVVSAYSSMEPESSQYEWLVKEFAAINRTATPWVFVSIHVPLYNTFDAHHRDLQVLAAQENLEPLLVDNSVNMVFTGHVHAYQRTKPVAFGEVMETGPVHVTVGSSGRQCCLTPFVSKKPEPWIASRDGTHYGYGRFAIFNETHAEWQWVPTSSLDESKGLPPNDIVMIQNQYFLMQR